MYDISIFIQSLDNNLPIVVFEDILSIYNLVDIIHINTIKAMII